MHSFLGLLLVPMVTLTPPLREARDPQDVLAQRLTSLHTRVYSLENMLLKPYETAPLDDLADWRSMMADFTGFVKTKGGPETEAMMAILNEASEQLIKERQRSWNLAIRKCLLQNPPVGLSMLDRSKIDFPKLDLADTIEGDNALQFKNRSVAKVLDDLEKLKKDKLYATKDRRDALAVVGRMALTLQLTIAKFHNDLVNLKKAKAGK